MSAVFDQQEWKQTCKKESAEAVKISGCIHDVYVENYSLSIEDLISSFPSNDRDKALVIAKEQGDYATPNEREQSAQWNREHGFCIHGLEPDCCPCGCGEY